MMKNNLFHFLFCALLSLLFLLLITPVGLTTDNLNYHNDILNFYNFQASLNESHERSISVLIPLYEEQTEQIVLYLKNDFISEDKIKLPATRLRVISSQNNLLLSKEPRQLNIKSDKIEAEDQPAVLLELSLLVEPSDLPGKYHSTLLILQPDPEGEKRTTEIDVHFQVQPWLFMEIESDIHKILAADIGNYQLHSTVPGRIFIAGNTPWQLWVKGSNVNENYLSGNSKTILNIYSADERLLIHEENVVLRKKEIMLAESGKTIIKPQEKCELNFEMEIENFISLPAGRISFPVLFRLEPILREEL